VPEYDIKLLEIIENLHLLTLSDGGLNLTNARSRPSNEVPDIDPRAIIGLCIFDLKSE
jgi:hypothetical protein